MNKEYQKTLVVLSHLFAGGQVEIDGYKWAVVKDGNETLLCIIGTQIVDNEEEGVLLKADLSFSRLVDLCSKITDDEMFFINASTVISEVRRNGIYR